MSTSNTNRSNDLSSSSLSERPNEVTSKRALHSSEQSSDQSKTFSKVAVLMGGRSSEHAVSVKTGEAIAEALRRLCYEVVVIDPSTNLIQQLIESGADVVFNALHGTYGEDGCIQGVLEWLGLPYTGSGIKASAVAMDKLLSKRIFSNAGIPVAEGRGWTRDDGLLGRSDLPPPPWVFKPNAEGSSVGVHRCETLETLHRHMETATGAWVIESWVEGVEVSITVVNGEAWGGIEIEPAQGWYDFEAKYQRKDTTYHCPPRLDSARLTPLYKYAERAFELFGCRGLARVDFICAPDREITLELNTLPGMTETSLVPKVAQARGVSFEALIEQLLLEARSDYE